MSSDVNNVGQAMAGAMQAMMGEMMKQMGPAPDKAAFTAAHQQAVKDLGALYKQGKLGFDANGKPVFMAGTPEPESIKTFGKMVIGAMFSGQLTQAEIEAMTKSFPAEVKAAAG
jgi:hypothetical protein